MATDSVLMKHVAPALGCVVAWAMFVSPLKAVLQVRKSRALGVSTRPLSSLPHARPCLLIKHTGCSCPEFVAVQPTQSRSLARPLDAAAILACGTCGVSLMAC